MNVLQLLLFTILIATIVTIIILISIIIEITIIVLIMSLSSLGFRLYSGRQVIYTLETNLETAISSQTKNWSIVFLLA